MFEGVPIRVRVRCLRVRPFHRRCNASLPVPPPCHRDAPSGFVDPLLHMALVSSVLPHLEVMEAHTPASIPKSHLPHVLWVMGPHTLRFINHKKSTSRKELVGCRLASVGGRLRVGWGSVEGRLRVGSE